MKKPTLLTDFHSTAKLSPADWKKLEGLMDLASEVFTDLIAAKLLPTTKGQTFHVSLLICGDERIKKLNHAHRQKDKVTDVLSFPAHESLRKLARAENDVFLGDLAISIPQARRQAKAFNIPVWDEFIHLYFHGLLHLVGFDHEISAQEEKLMQKWEDKALDLLSGKKKGGPKAPSKK